MGSMDDARLLIRQSRTASQGNLPEEARKVGLAEFADQPPSPTSSFVTAPSSPDKDISSNAPKKSHIVHQKHKINTPKPADLAKPAKMILPTLPEKPFECACLSIHQELKSCLDTKFALNVEQAWLHLYSWDSMNSDFLRSMWVKNQYTGKDSRFSLFV